MKVIKFLESIYLLDPELDQEHYYKEFEDRETELKGDEKK